MRQSLQLALAASVMALGASASIANARRATRDNDAPSAVSWLRAGPPDMQSAGALTFTPDGLLIVGDSRGAAVFALDVADTAVATDTVSLKQIDVAIAARLGTTAGDIAINDIAVHPRSHAVYVSVTRGLGAGGRPAIVRVGPRGRLDLVALDRIPFAKAVLPNPPIPGMKDDDGDDASDRAITDLVVARGSLFVAGVRNDAFQSTLHRIPIPFTRAIVSTGIRIYHAHHSKFETKSPITAMTAYSAGGRDYLLASYACTPVAVFAMNSLVAGAQVTGKTIAELGAGTHATDLVTFAWKDRRYLAVATVGRSLQILEADDLAAATSLDSTNNPARNHPLGAWFSWGVSAYSGAQPGVLHVADFDATYAVVLQRNVVTGTLNLRPLAKPILWARGV